LVKIARSPKFATDTNSVIEAAPPGAIVMLLFGAALLAICVAIHAAGSILLARWFFKDAPGAPSNFLKSVWQLIRVAWGLTLLHGLEISVWAFFYWWKGCMPDLSTAYYFSSITYTTVGYGDLVLHTEWRHLSSVEALTGILMAGLSTGFFFLALSRVFSVRHPSKSG
jgi:hypothetical protein